MQEIMQNTKYLLAEESVTNYSSQRYTGWSTKQQSLKISRIETRGELSPRGKLPLQKEPVPIDENLVSFVVRMPSQEESGDQAEQDKSPHLRVGVSA